MAHAVVGFAAAQEAPLKSIESDAIVPPSEYLAYFMDIGDETKLPELTGAKRKAEMVKRISEMLQRERYIRAMFTSAFPKALAASADAAAAASGDAYRELFVLVEEFCLLLIPLGWWAASLEAVDPVLLNQCKAAYMEGTQHKMKLMASENMRPLIDYAAEKFGLIAF